MTPPLGAAFVDAYGQVVTVEATSMEWVQVSWPDGRMGVFSLGMFRAGFKRLRRKILA